MLKKTTVNRYLKQWGYDKERLSRQPPAVRFEAEYSNQCWHFDLSSSDLKRLKNSVELEPGRGKPLLMLYSVVDDRSGVSYQEYHEVYGEDVGAALKFLFNAISAKEHQKFPGLARSLARRAFPCDLRRRGVSPLTLDTGVEGRFLINFSVRIHNRFIGFSNLPLRAR